MISNLSSGQLAAWCIVLYLHVAGVPAAPVTLAWDANAEPILGGYRLYYWHSRQAVPLSVDVGNRTRYTFTRLADNMTWYFFVTAYDNTRAIESNRSNQIAWSTGTAPAHLLWTHPTNGCARISLVDREGNLGGYTGLGCNPGWWATSYDRSIDGTGPAPWTQPHRGCSTLATADAQRFL